MKKQSSERPEASASLGEYVYQALSRSIRDGEYQPGDHIRESLVTKQLNVSRTPVRDALRRLNAEGRINFEPNRGAFVAELQRQEVAELYMLRQRLEGTAARFAAQYASDAEIYEMERILECSKSLEGNPREFNQINWELHHAIVHAAHNRFLIRVFDSISDALALLRGIKYIPAGRPALLYDEHAQIIEMIKAHDLDAADRVAQEHVQQAFRMHLQSASYNISSK